MRFWDSSAIVPLLLEQPLSERARSLLVEDRDMVVWWGTPVECASAFSRLRREGPLTAEDESGLGRLLERVRAGWFEMVPGDQIWSQALRVLRLHPLRAGDAFQLAAALEWSDAPSSDTLITFDERLGSAAIREGFIVTGRTGFSQG